MIVLKKVKENKYAPCKKCYFYPIGSSMFPCNNCHDKNVIYKKLPVKNVVVIDGIAYEKKDCNSSLSMWTCSKCGLLKNQPREICDTCRYTYYKKLGKVVRHVNSNK